MHLCTKLRIQSKMYREKWVLKVFWRILGKNGWLEDISMFGVKSLCRKLNWDCILSKEKIKWNDMYLRSWSVLEKRKRCYEIIIRYFEWIKFECTFLLGERNWNEKNTLDSSLKKNSTRGIFLQWKFVLTRLSILTSKKLIIYFLLFDK